MDHKPATKTISKAKSDAAMQKPRVGGKFVAKDPDAAAKKKAAKEIALRDADTKRIAENGFTPADMISEEDRERFGSDAFKFLEVALSKAPTWYEGLKYAKELIARQYPTLQAIQSKQEIEITTKVLRWQPQWDETGDTIEPQDPPTISDTSPTDDQLLLSTDGTD